MTRKGLGSDQGSDWDIFSLLSSLCSSPFSFFVLFSCPFRLYFPLLILSFSLLSFPLSLISLLSFLFLPALLSLSFSLLSSLFALLSSLFSCFSSLFLSTLLSFPLSLISLLSFLFSPAATLCSILSFSLLVRFFHTFTNVTMGQINIKMSQKTLSTHLNDSLAHNVLLEKHNHALKITH